MFEKVNPSHPDKIADRISGAVVDLAYQIQDSPTVACEVLIGHGKCHTIIETSATRLDSKLVEKAIHRIAGNEVECDIVIVPQDKHLAKNQSEEVKCGDNGIFKGVPITGEQRILTNIAKDIYGMFPFDGKYILDGNKLVICQSNASNEKLREMFPDAIINPLGEWEGGINADSGVTGRKLGSDMADSVTGGSPLGKDLSKADVSVNIYAWLKAQKENKPVVLSCAIGDTEIDGKPYKEIVKIAKDYIDKIGGFEKLAEWGLVR